MNQQSEHLSNAQIEQYGNQASGAGPETEEWVEQHLADCPACRSRVLEFQRIRLGLLPDPKVNKVPTSDCPGEDELRSLAAGLYSGPVAQKLNAHTATCDHCGPLLREYTEDFSDNVTSDEQAFLDQLSSASPRAQEQRARAVLKQAGLNHATVEQATLESTPRSPAPILAARPPSSRRLFSWKWIMVPAMASVALIAVGIWYLQRDTPEKVEKLLAQAYTEERTMEMRWPGAEWGALQTRERGSTSTASASAYEAKAAILKHLNKRPDDPEWLQKLGQEEMLEWQTEEAITDLNRALQLMPNSVPIMVDLAIGYYQRAERQQGINDYRQSIALFGKALSLRPDDPIILFNRALLYQRMSPPLYEASLADWDRLLVKEPSGRWSEEARQHKREIEEIKKNSR